jgi:hypothetical protein
MGKRKYDRDEIIRLYKEGLNLREVADKVGCTFQNVHLHLVRQGVPLRPRSIGMRLRPRGPYKNGN